MNNFLVKYSINSKEHTAKGYFSLTMTGGLFQANCVARRIADDETDKLVPFGDYKYINNPDTEFMVIEEVTPISMTNLKVLQKFSII